MMKAAQYVLIVILALSLLAPVFLSWQPPAKADTALSFQEQAHPYLPNDPSRFDPSVGIGAGINIPPPFLVENYGYTCAATYGFATSTATGVTQTQFPNLVFRGWAGSAQLPGCGLAGSVGGSLPSLQNNLTFSLFLTPTAPSTTISFQYYYYSTSTGNSFYIVLTYTLLGSSTVVGIGSRIATSSTSGPIQSFSVSVTLTSPICLRFSVARSAFINDYAIIRNLNITGAQINNMPSSSRPCLPNDTPNLKFIDYSTGNPRDLVGSVSSPLSSPVYITYKSNIPFNFNDLIEYLPFDGSDSNSFLRNRALPGGLATTNTTSTSYMPSFVSSGKFGGAAQFATGGTYNPAVLSDIKLPPLNAFTVSFWFKYISGTGYAPIVGFGNIISNYVLEVNNGGQLKVEMCSTGATLNPNSAVNLLDGAWHYIAFVFTSPTSVIGYVDGGSASASLSANFVTSGIPTLAPGVCGAKSAGGLTIQLDDFRIYARALSSSEINTLYSIGISGLVGYWTFDEGSGSYAYDYSGNGNTGTLVNGPTWVSGRFGNALQFVAASAQYVTVPDSPAFNSLDSYTLTAWIKSSGFASGPNRIISQQPGGTQYFIMDINRDRANHLSFCDSRIGTCATFTALPQLNDNLWHFVAVSISRSGTSLTATGYVDLNQQTLTFTGTASALNTAGVPLQIGRLNGGGEYFNGIIDDVRIYNRALSASEIQQLYMSTAPSFGPFPILPNLFGGYTTIGTQGSQLIYGGVKTSALFVPQLFNYSATAQVTVWYGSYYYRTLVINPNLQSYYGGVWGQYLNVYIDDPSRVVPYVINVIDLAKIFPSGSIVAVLSGNSTIITSGLLDTSMTVFAYLVPGTYNVLLMNPSGQKMNFLVNFGSLSSINIIVPGSNLVVNPGGLPFLSASFVISCDLKTAYLSFTDSYQITASVTFKLYVANVTGNYLVAQQTVTGTVGSNGLSNIGTASVTLTGIPTGATIDQIYAIVNATSLSSVPSSVPAQPYGRVVTNIQPRGTSGTCPGLVVGTPPSFPGDVLGLSQIFPFPNAWLFLLSVSLILMVGFAFSARDADVGTFIMLLMAAAFMAMGWLPLIPGWIITLLFIAFVRLALSRWRRRRMGA